MCETYKCAPPQRTQRAPRPGVTTTAAVQLSSAWRTRLKEVGIESQQQQANQGAPRACRARPLTLLVATVTRTDERSRELWRRNWAVLHASPLVRAVNVTILSYSGGCEGWDVGRFHCEDMAPASPRFVPKLSFHARLSPQPGTDAVWLLDDDLSFDGFDAARFFALWQCAFASGWPMVAQPLKRRSAGATDWWHVKEESWRLAPRALRRVVAHQCAIVEQQMPLFDASFFRHFVRRVGAELAAVQARLRLLFSLPPPPSLGASTSACHAMCRLIYPPPSTHPPHCPSCRTRTTQTTAPTCSGAGSRRPLRPTGRPALSSHAPR